MNARKISSKLKMCHLKWRHKICNQTFSYRFIVTAILDINRIYFGAYLLIKAMENMCKIIIIIKKIKSDRKTGELSLET